MIRIIKIASALIAVIVGAGFASGQEILQFFTSFGVYGTFGAIVSTVLFGYFGAVLVRIGSKLKSESHHEAIFLLSGKFLGIIIDIVITITLFGVGVVMLAGSGAIVHQQFSFSPFIGSLLMAIVVILTMFLRVEKVIAVIGTVTPFLIVAIVILSIYSVMTKDYSTTYLHQMTQSYPSPLPLPHWFIAALNYVSFNIAIGAGMALLIGGAENDEKKAILGGCLGGLSIGILILLSHLAIFSRIETVMHVDLPLLLIMNEISGILGFGMTFILLAMIYSTAVSMFYTFTARFFKMDGKKTILPIVITVAVGFVASFIGFTKLVAKFYPFIGYLGFVLMFVLLYAPFKLRKI